MRSPRPAAAALCAAIVLALAGCGSQLDPQTVARVNGGGTAASGGVLDPTGAEVAPDGVAPGTDTGTGTDGDTGAAADPAAGSDPGGAGTATGGDAPDAGGRDQGQDGGQGSPTSGVKAGDCAGFRNQTGITDDTVTIANTADISGPVPGLFQAAQDAVKAFVAYYNTSGQRLCGRSLALDALDTRTDAGGDQQVYSQACDTAFAVVGSVSSQDQGGAATAQQCGIPDLRAFVTTPQRAACTTCFAAYTIQPDVIPTVTGKFFLARYREATQRAAMFYVNVQAASVNARSYAAGLEKQGFRFDIVQGIDTSEFNYAPYVQQMKDKGTQYVQYFGPYQFAVRLQQAMEQQNYRVPVYLEDPTIYDQGYVDSVGAAGDKSFVYSVIDLFDDTKNPEMVLYRQWLNQVRPGAVPNYYGLFAWSAARMFVAEATKLGGDLTRASLVAAMKRVDDWTGNGLHAPMHVGAKRTSECMKIIQLSGGTWRQVSPGGYMCGPTLETGVKN